MAPPRKGNNKKNSSNNKQQKSKSKNFNKNNGDSLLEGESTFDGCNGATSRTSPGPNINVYSGQGSSTHLAAFSLGGEFASIAVVPYSVFITQASSDSTTTTTSNVFSAITPEIIADKHGERMIPAYVAFVDRDDNSSNKHDIIAASDAYAQRIRNLTRTVSAFVPIIDLPVNHPKVVAYSGLSNVEISAPKNGSQNDPAVFVIKNPTSTITNSNYNNNNNSKNGSGVLEVTAAELCTHLLRSLRVSAESHCGSVISQCAISYSPDFEPHQVAALRLSAIKVGLDPVIMIPSSEAALIAYDGQSLQNPEKSVTFVVDIGATASILSSYSVDCGLYSQISKPTVFPTLGSRVFDAHFVNHIIKTTPSVAATVSSSSSSSSCINDINSCKARGKLLAATERCRRELSTLNEARFYVEAFHSDGTDFVTTVSQIRLTSCASLWLEELRSAIESAISDSSLCDLEVDRVIVIGGASRIPRVAQIIEDMFPLAKILSNIEPDECSTIGTATAAVASVATLAAAAAANKEGDKKEEENEFCGVSLLGKALGIVDAESRFRQLIGLYMPLPVRQVAVITTPINDLTKFIKIIVAEGRDIADEEELSEKFGENEFIPLYNAYPLGELVIPIKPNTEINACEDNLFARVRIEFEIDLDGTAKVTATQVYNSDDTDQNNNNNDKMAGDERPSTTLVIPVTTTAA